jgi:hypothetical protein
MRVVIGSGLAALLAVGTLLAATAQATIGAHHAAEAIRAGASAPAPDMMVASRSGHTAVYGWVHDIK